MIGLGADKAAAAKAALMQRRCVGVVIVGLGFFAGTHRLSHNPSQFPVTVGALAIVPVQLIASGREHQVAQGRTPVDPARALSQATFRLQQAEFVLGFRRSFELQIEASPGIVRVDHEFELVAIAALDAPTQRRTEFDWSGQLVVGLDLSTVDRLRRPRLQRKAPYAVAAHDRTQAVFSGSENQSVAPHDRTVGRVHLQQQCAVRTEKGQSGLLPQFGLMLEAPGGTLGSLLVADLEREPRLARHGPENADATGPQLDHRFFRR